MKKLSILLFAACIIPNFLYAQEPLALDTVLQVPNMGKEQIYKVAKQWFVDNMNDASRVIQLDDEKDCIIMGKYNILNSATHIVRNKFKILSHNILPSILPCQKIHLT